MCRIILPLLTLVAVAGCVTAPPPIKDYVRTTPSFPAVFEQIQSVGLIADATVAFDSSSVSNRYITLQDSRIAVPIF